MLECTRYHIRYFFKRRIFDGNNARCTAQYGNRIGEAGMRVVGENTTACGDGSSSARQTDERKREEAFCEKPRPLILSDANRVSYCFSTLISCKNCSTSRTRKG